MAKKQIKGQQEPPPELVADIKAALLKHKWSGTMIWKPAALAKDTPCPPGTVPHEYSYQRSDGTWVTETICV
jgi:hypothetical protein